MGATGGATKPTATQPTTAPAKAAKVSVSFKGMTIEKIGAFLAEKLKKPVHVSEAVKSKKITIICKDKKTLKDSVYLIRQVLLAEGIMVEQLNGLVRIRPVTEGMQTLLTRVPADKSVATIEDELQIVAKEFLIKHYDVGKMMAVLEPMLPSFGYIMADPDTRRMVVTDTVTNLLRMERIVAAMDVPMAEQTLTEIIKLEHEDAAAVIAIVKWLIAGRMRIDVKDITTAGPAVKGAQPSGRRARRQRYYGPWGMMMFGGRSSRAQPSGRTPASSAQQIQASKTPVTLVPHVSRNWIIAVAPAETMAQIKIWVKQLDKPREVQKDYEMYDVKYADIEDIARQIERTF